MQSQAAAGPPPSKTTLFDPNLDGKPVAAAAAGLVFRAALWRLHAKQQWRGAGWTEIARCPPPGPRTLMHSRKHIHTCPFSCRFRCLTNFGGSMWTNPFVQRGHSVV